jgi:HlyD family secretion protein
MTRRNGLIAAAVVLVAVLGVLALGRGKSRPTQYYETATVTRGEVEATVSASGTLKPVERVEVGSAVSGRILRIHADYNSKVRAGDVLAEIDPSAFRARVAQFEAGAARARATLRQAELDLGRQEELFAERLVADAELERARTVRDQAKADLQQVEAQLASARADLENTQIRAPIDGVVLTRKVDEGQTVAASLQAPTLFEIARDLKDMQVETSVDEADIGQVRAGQSVRFTVDAYPGRTFWGVVDQVRLQSTTTSGVVTFTVLLRTRNENMQLRPGMTADVTIEVAKRSDGLVIPNSSLRVQSPDFGRAVASPGRPSPGDSTVYVLRAGTPTAAFVRPLLSNGLQTLVSSDALKEGDEVVTQVSAGTGPAASKSSPLGSFGPPRSLGRKRT